MPDFLAQVGGGGRDKMALPLNVHWTHGCWAPGTSALYEEREGLKQAWPPQGSLPALPNVALQPP